MEKGGGGADDRREHACKQISMIMDCISFTFFISCLCVARGLLDIMNKTVVTMYKSLGFTCLHGTLSRLF